jgi:hypothetical protein
VSILLAEDVEQKEIREKNRSEVQFRSMLSGSINHY